MNEQAQRKILDIDKKIKELEELRQLLVDITNEWGVLDLSENENICICPLIGSDEIKNREQEV